MDVKEIYTTCKEQVKRRVREEGAYTDEQVQKLILEVIAKEHRAQWIPLRDRVIIGRRIFHALRGLDILQPLMEDEEITDIMVNGAEHIYFEKNGQMQRYGESFENVRRLEDLIQQIVGSVNRSVNEASPIADARLADGSRVHVVLPPTALNGPILTIRRFRKNPITMEELIQWGTLTEEMAAYLQTAVEQKRNIFVCGGTASGKTTLLNVLAGFIPPEERIITIEDAAELRLSKLENVVTLETRNAGRDGQGGISMRELIKASLRMNPDRIIVGEVRGAEALDMLQAMNTGHEGSISTGHANSCQDMLMRIETMALMGAEMPLEAIRQQMASAIDLLVYVEKRREGRRLSEIREVCGYEQGQVKTRVILERKVLQGRGEEIVWANQEGSEGLANSAESSGDPAE